VQHVPKQSHHVRCPALELLRNSLCGPLRQKKSLEVPGLIRRQFKRGRTVSANWR